MKSSGPAKTVLAAAALAAVLMACGGGGGGGGGGTGTGATGTPARSGTQATTTADRSDAVAACPATPGSADAGPVLTTAPTNGLPTSQIAGERLVIAAQVLDADCGPAAGANVTVWHTDASGRYGPSGQDCCYYGGTVTSDDQGRFRLESIRPGQYPEPGAPRAHIHVRVEHGSAELETEIVFEGSPAEHVVPVTLEQVSPRAGDRHWYGEATLVLGR